MINLRTLFSNKKAKCRPRINLLIEIISFDKGGMQKVVLDMAARLDPKEFKVIIATPGEVGYLAGLAEAQGIRVAGCKDELELEQLVKDEKIMISNSHFSDFGYPVYNRMKIPNVTFIHNVYAFLPDSEREKISLNDRFVDSYISVSKNATRYAVNRLGISQDKVHTIPNGLIIKEHIQRLADRKPVSRKDFGLKSDDYVFLNVASYNLHKGHYLMADAMKRLLKKRTDIKILCLGNEIYPPHVEEFRAYLKENSLDKHILMPGYHPDVESFYATIDAFLLPSFIEGWSIAMNEAMFYEKPMILTDTGASAEVIEDIGILIDNEYGDTLNLDSALLDSTAYEKREYNTSNQLAAAMENFADNREYWKEAGKKGLQKVVKFFNFDKIVQRYEDVFKTTLENTK